MRSIAIGLAVLWWPMSSAPLTAAELQPAQTATVIDSLGYIYYRNTPMPTPPDDAELIRAEESLASIAPAEGEFLGGIYADNTDLIAYALRDSDGDGINDYRVQNNGRFAENDVDVDGDGIRNTLDKGPYDAEVGFDDVNRNRIPDHVDWSLRADTAAYAKVQKKFYRKYRVMLVDKDAAFPEQLARTLYDFYRKIYARWFRKAGSNHPGVQGSALQVIATESTYGDEYTLAWASAPAGLLTLYEGSNYYLDRPFYLMKTLVHELMHMAQFTLDYNCTLPFDPQSCTDVSYTRMKKHNVYYAERYYEWMRQLGWDITQVGWTRADEPLETLSESTDCTDIFHHVVKHSCYFVPVREVYRGRSPAEWRDELATQWDAHGDDYLDTPVIADAYIPGDYAMTDAWEWLAENMVAYAMIKTLDAARRYCSSEQHAQLMEDAKALMRSEMYFEIDNVRRNETVMNFLSPRFKGSSKRTWRFFAKRHLLPSHPGVCGDR